MFDISQLNQYNFHDGSVTEGKKSYLGRYILRGEFPEDETERSGCKYFSFEFKNVQPLPPEIEDAEILVFEITRDSEVYLVKLYGLISVPRVPTADRPYKHTEEPVSVEFACSDISFSRKKYNGLSYRNVYGTKEYSAYRESLQYLLDETYFTGKERFDLPENHSLEIEEYTDAERGGFLQRHTLRRNGEIIYTYLCSDRQISPFYEFIYHKNGHRYYPFHIDLYGISYLDIDTLEVYNYIPEGYQHDCEQLLGESFIITDIHYDRESGLIAYGGCYWAGPPNVMVGDFSCVPDCGFPLEDIQAWLDPHYDQYDEFDFAGWSKEKLLLKSCQLSVSVEIDQLRERLNKSFSR